MSRQLKTPTNAPASPSNVPPKQRPQRPFFSSGPCVKPPGWQAHHLSRALTGRYHRSAHACDRLHVLFGKMRRILGLPEDYRVYLVPGSDTGAFEAALWNLLGPRRVDVLAWDRFGRRWLDDVARLLPDDSVRAVRAPDGDLADVTAVSPHHDVVFTWTGTGTGVCVADGDWIDDARDGLTLCDATSAVFVQDLPWSKLDATTFSWQKAMGGEAQHGVLVLSPRALHRLTTHPAPRPIPTLFYLDPAPGNATGEGMINTPSLLCVEDAILALDWLESIGGLSGAMVRTQANFNLLDRWVARVAWVHHLASRPEHRAPTPVCLRLDGARHVPQSMANILEREGVAYDIRPGRFSPEGLRIWTGPTVALDDLKHLLAWLEWAYAEAGQSSLHVS